MSMKDTWRAVLSILQYQHLDGTLNWLDNPILCNTCAGIDIVPGEPVKGCCAGRHNRHMSRNLVLVLEPNQQE